MRLMQSKSRVTVKFYCGKKQDRLGAVMASETRDFNFLQAWTFMMAMRFNNIRKNKIY